MSDDGSDPRRRTGVTIETNRKLVGGAIQQGVGGNAAGPNTRGSVVAADAGVDGRAPALWRQRNRDVPGQHGRYHHWVVTADGSTQRNRCGVFHRVDGVVACHRIQCQAQIADRKVPGCCSADAGIGVARAVVDRTAVDFDVVGIPGCQIGVGVDANHAARDADLAAANGNAGACVQGVVHDAHVAAALGNRFTEGKLQRGRRGHAGRVIQRSQAQERWRHQVHGHLKNIGVRAVAGRIRHHGAELVARIR